MNSGTEIAGPCGAGPKAACSAKALQPSPSLLAVLLRLLVAGKDADREAGQ